MRGADTTMGKIFDSPGLLIVLILLLIVLFGAKRLPELARSLGKSARILKEESDGLRSGESVETAEGPAATVTTGVAAPPPQPVITPTAAQPLPTAAQPAPDPAQVAELQRQLDDLQRQLKSVQAPGEQPGPSA